MNFPDKRPDSIRAINQRWLINFWQRSRGDRKLPLWQDVEPQELSRVATTLSFVDVTEHEGNERFLIRFSGPTIARAYGKTDCRGLFLDEVIPADHYRIAYIPYRQTVATRQPIYTIQDLTDSNGRLVHYERLLLPFSSDAENVDRILASFELVCPDGAFDSDGLLNFQDTRPELKLSATIVTNAMA